MWLEIRNRYDAKIRNNQETRIAKIFARGTAIGAGDRVRMCTNSGATKKANGPVCGSKPLPVYNEHYQDSTFNGASNRGRARFLQITGGHYNSFSAKRNYRCWDGNDTFSRFRSSYRGSSICRDCGSVLYRKKCLCNRWFEM